MVNLKCCEKLECIKSSNCSRSCLSHEKLDWKTNFMPTRSWVKIHMLMQNAAASLANPGSLEARCNIDLSSADNTERGKNKHSFKKNESPRPVEITDSFMGQYASAHVNYRAQLAHPTNLTVETAIIGSQFLSHAACSSSPHTASHHAYILTVLPLCSLFFPHHQRAMNSAPASYKPSSDSVNINVAILIPRLSTNI